MSAFALGKQQMSVQKQASERLSFDLINLDKVFLIE